MTANKNELDDFLEQPNNFHPNLRMRVPEGKSISFDVTVRIN